MGKFMSIVVLVVVIALVAAGFLWLVNAGNHTTTINPNASSTAPTLVLQTTTSTTANGTDTVSDGTITFSPPSDFGLAVTQDQILVKSYIPPCDPDFDYCLYYVGTAYQGTNFESAGIRIEQRTDLTTQSACMTTPPTGYANFTPTSTTAGDYSVSEFTPLGDAAAGHFSTGTLYRLEYSGKCYEFETRIGQAQFANYPAGTIKQFTTADETSLQSEIQKLLDSITLSSGEAINFPH